LVRSKYASWAARCVRSARAVIFRPQARCCSSRSTTDFDQPFRRRESPQPATDAAAGFFGILDGAMWQAGMGLVRCGPQSLPRQFDHCRFLLAPGTGPAQDELFVPFPLGGPPV
jgi:hypothetical protein